MPRVRDSRLDDELIADCILQGLSPAYALQAAYAGRAFLAWLGRPVTEATESDARRYILWLMTSQAHHRSGRRSPNTIYRALTYLRKWAQYYVNIGLIDIDPFAKIRGPKRLYKMMQPMPDEDLMRVLGHVHEYGASPALKRRNTAAIYTLADTGVRAAELLSMDRATWIDERIIVRGKGSKERFVPINPPVARLIDLYLSTRTDSDPWLWADMWGRRWTFYGLRQLVSQLKKNLGIEALGIHAFRRKSLTLLAEQGMAQAHIRAISGHTSDHALLPYIHAADASKAMEEHRRLSPVSRILHMGDEAVGP